MSNIKTELQDIDISEQGNSHQSDESEADGPDEDVSQSKKRSAEESLSSIESLSEITDKESETEVINKSKKKISVIF